MFIHVYNVFRVHPALLILPLPPCSLPHPSPNFVIISQREDPLYNRAFQTQQFSSFKSRYFPFSTGGTILRLLIGISKWPVPPCLHLGAMIKYNS